MVAVSTGPNRVRPRTRPPCSALGCVVCYRDDNPRSRTFGITRQLRMPIADGWTGHRRDVGRRGPTVHRTYVLSSSCSHCPARGVPELLPPRVAGVHRCEDVHVGVRVLSPPAERPSREPSERRVRTPCGYGSTAPTGTLETCVPTPAKRPDPSATSRRAGRPERPQQPRHNVRPRRRHWCWRLPRNRPALARLGAGVRHRCSDQGHAEGGRRVDRAPATAEAMAPASEARNLTSTRSRSNPQTRTARVY